MKVLQDISSDKNLLDGENQPTCVLQNLLSRRHHCHMMSCYNDDKFFVLLTGLKFNVFSPWILPLLIIAKCWQMLLSFHRLSQCSQAFFSPSLQFFYLTGRRWIDFLSRHPSCGLCKPRYNNDQILLLKEAWCEPCINENFGFHYIKIWNYLNSRPLLTKPW